MEPKADSKTWVIVTLVVAVLGFLGTIIAAWIGNMPKGQTTTEPGAIPTVQAPTPPTLTQYILYDDFTAAGAYAGNWWADDPNALCQFDVRQAKLLFTCFNKATSDTVVTLHPKAAASPALGVVVMARAEKAGGAFELATNWQCATDNTQRAYHLALGVDTVRATEYFPQEDWRMNELGHATVAVGQEHWLQIEHKGGMVEFMVDGQSLALQTQPSLTTCYTMQDWSLDFLVWKDSNRLTGYVTKVSTRLP